VREGVCVGSGVCACECVLEKVWERVHGRGEKKKSFGGANGNEDHTHTHTHTHTEGCKREQKESTRDGRTRENATKEKDTLKEMIKKIIGANQVGREAY
jgi:hypothetical protein